MHECVHLSTDLPTACRPPCRRPTHGPPRCPAPAPSTQHQPSIPGTAPGRRPALRAGWGSDHACERAEEFNLQYCNWMRRMPWSETVQWSTLTLIIQARGYCTDLSHAMNAMRWMRYPNLELQLVNSIIQELVHWQSYHEMQCDAMIPWSELWPRQSLGQRYTHGGLPMHRSLLVTIYHLRVLRSDKNTKGLNY